VNAWPPAGATFFNPDPAVSRVPLAQGQHCWVIDDALADPEGLVEWARGQAFEPPQGYPYPGVVVDATPAVTQRMSEYFAQYLRKHLGVRRIVDLTCRLSMVTLPPAKLEPRQWLCHRDRIAADPRQTLFAASVLYLFREAAVGGTSFYVPRQDPAATDRMLADSQMLEGPEFSARYGVRPGYMTDSNAYFERIASVPAAWNRLIFYDGGLFHSADVEQPTLLSADPARGRLTLNGFFTCKRNAS